MLHDAMLQYFLQLSPESEDFTQFLSLVIGDNKEEESRSAPEFGLHQVHFGSEIVCMTLAYIRKRKGTTADNKGVQRRHRNAGVR